MRLADGRLVRICEGLCGWTMPTGLMMNSEKQLSGRAEPLGRGAGARGARTPAHLAPAARRSGQDQHVHAGEGAVGTPPVHARHHDQAGGGARGRVAQGERGRRPHRRGDGHACARRARLLLASGGVVASRTSTSRYARRSATPMPIYAYRTEICWDAARSSLIFRESERIDADFAQQGTVSVPHESGYVYLVTNRQGQYRLVIVSRPTYGEMFGIMTTLQVGRGNQLLPVSARDRLSIPGRAHRRRVRPDHRRPFLLRGLPQIPQVERSKSSSPGSCRGKRPYS